MKAPGSKIRVLIVDDSVVAREMLTQILGSDERIEVVGQAVNGAEAVEMVARLRPDLVTMDIHMPVMDGLGATEKIMAYTPTPILVVSSSVHGEGVGKAFDALSLGALDVIKKPEPRDWADLERIARDVIRKVRILSNVAVITHIRGKERTAPSVLESVHVKDGKRSIVAVGASTGGPTALLTVLAALPEDFPVPIVVAQHIAEGFVDGLVRWLDSSCRLRVVTAIDGVRMEPGAAYFAPTGSNAVVDGACVRLVPVGSNQFYTPNVDVLFDSVARAHGAGAVGVLLTGMGADGAEGLRKMRAAGAATIAQDEGSCTVFGMPKAAIALDAAEHVVELGSVAEKIEEIVAAP